MSLKYLYVVLLGLIVLSKELLVFNEEALVLLAFALFIYLFLTYGGEVIAKELDSRKEKIKEEFDLYKNLQLKTFTHLVNYHKKQKLLNLEIKEILAISKLEILSIEKYYQCLLGSFIILNFEERLKRVLINENKTNTVLKKEIFKDLRLYLLNSYSIKNNRMSLMNRKLLLKKSVEQLKTCY